MLLQFFMIIKLSFFYWIARARFNSLKHNKLCSEPKEGFAPFWNPPKEKAKSIKAVVFGYGL